jgi:hypothetical protein
MASDRTVIQGKLLGLLDQYLTGQIDTEEFRSTFDKKTRSEWDRFGLKGISGAMFLNMLVKYIPDEEALATHLKSALRLPIGVGEAQKQMKAFLQFLEGLISAGQVTAKQIQVRSLSF